VVWYCPVGGIKEKTLAALNAGIKTVILPARNRKDWEDIPENARNQMRFIWVERVDEVIAAIFAGSGCGCQSPRL
jgi:ATP-dependent Lon protease